MSEYKSDQWPEVVQRVIDSGGRICGFQDVPVKADCMVQIQGRWVKGFRLPETHFGANFLLTDERWPKLHNLYCVGFGAVAITIPEAKPTEETVDTTIGRLFRGDLYYDMAGSKCILAWPHHDINDVRKVIVGGPLSGRMDYPTSDKMTPAKKIVCKGK